MKTRKRHLKGLSFAQAVLAALTLVSPALAQTTQTVLGGPPAGGTGASGGIPFALTPSNIGAPGATSLQFPGATPSGTQLNLDGLLCSSNTDIQGSFGLPACTDLNANLTQMLSQNISHIIYYYYMGEVLVPDNRNLYVAGASGGPAGAFCQMTQGPTGPSTPLKAPTPICNIGSVHQNQLAGSGGDEHLMNYMGQYCDGSSPTTPTLNSSLGFITGGSNTNTPVANSINAGGKYSQGFCDFSGTTLPGSSNISINSLCPNESQYVVSIQPQLLENAFETVTTELTSGQINLTTASYQGTSVQPCGYFLNVLNRIILGNNPTGATSSPVSGFVGLNGLRQNASQWNTGKQAQTNPLLIFNDRLNCLDATATNGQTMVGARSQYSVGSCNAILAQKYAEFVLSQLLVCEVTTLAQQNYAALLNDPVYNPNSQRLAAVSSYSTCEDYAQTQAVPPIADGSSGFWSNPAAQRALYSCYLSGTTTGGYTPPSAPGFGAVPPGPSGVVTMLSNWASGYKGSPPTASSAIAALVVKKGVLYPYAPLPNAPWPGPNGGYPPCALSIAPLLAALAARRRRKHESKLGLRLALLFVTCAALAAIPTSAHATTVTSTCPDGTQTSASPTQACVCTAANNACQTYVYNSLRACYTDVLNSMVIPKLGGPSGASASIPNTLATIEATHDYDLTAVQSCSCTAATQTCVATISEPDNSFACTHCTPGSEQVNPDLTYSGGNGSSDTCCSGGSSLFSANQSDTRGGDPGCSTGGTVNIGKGCQKNSTVAQSALDQCSIMQLYNACPVSKPGNLPASSCGYLTAINAFQNTDLPKCTSYTEELSFSVGGAAAAESAQYQAMQTYWHEVQGCMDSTGSLQTDLTTLSSMGSGMGGLAYQSAVSSIKIALQACDSLADTAISVCASTYSPTCSSSSAWASNSMAGAPVPGDSTEYSGYYQVCLANMAPALANNCSAPPITQPPTSPPTAQLAASPGDQALMDAAQSLDFGNSGNLTHATPNTGGGADTMALAPVGPSTNTGSPHTGGGAAGTAYSFTAPNTALPTSLGTSGTSVGGGVGLGDNPTADASGASGSSGALNPALASDAATAYDSAGGGGAGGNNAGRRPSGTGAVGADGQSTSELAMSSLGIHGAFDRGATGSPGPSVDGEVDGREPFLYNKNASLFEMISRRYRKKTVELVPPTDVPAPQL